MYLGIIHLASDSDDDDDTIHFLEGKVDTNHFIPCTQLQKKKNSFSCQFISQIKYCFLIPSAVGNETGVSKERVKFIL